MADILYAPRGQCNLVGGVWACNWQPSLKRVGSQLFTPLALKGIVLQPLSSFWGKIFKMLPSAVFALQALQLCSVLCTLTSHASAPKAPGRCFWAGCAVPLSCAGPCPTPAPSSPCAGSGSCPALEQRFCCWPCPATSCPSSFVNVYIDLLLSVTTPWQELANGR